MFFKSNNVKIFPCFHRGQYTENNKTLYYNPESRLATEYNFTHIPGLLLGYDSFVIEHTNACVRCVIHGYYFEFTGDAAGKLQDHDGNLKGKLIIREGKLASQSENGSNYLLTMAAGDQPFLDTGNDDESYCTAVWYDFETSNDLNMPAKFSGTEGIIHTLDLEDKYRRIIIKDDVHSLQIIDEVKGAVNNNTNAIKAINDGTSGILAAAKIYVGNQVTALKGTKANGDTTAETIRGAKDYADKVTAAAVETINGQVNTNKTDIENLQTDIENLQTALGPGTPGGSANASITSRVEQAEGNIDSLKTRATALEATVNGSGEGESRVPGLVEKVAALEAVDNATQAELDAYKIEVATAIGNALKDAKDYADQNDADTKYDDTALAGRVSAIEVDYLKAADKYDDAALVGRVTSAETKIADLEADYLKRSDLEAAVIGVYAVAFVLQGAEINIETRLLLAEKVGTELAAALPKVSSIFSGVSDPDSYEWRLNSIDGEAVKKVNINATVYAVKLEDPEITD